MSEQRKLYQLSGDQFRLVEYVDESDELVTSDAKGIPALLWPDGRWCLPANMYMLELFKRGLSRRFDGGTLKTYATQLSHLVRYCFSNGYDFVSLTNGQFSAFMRKLADEETDSKPGVRRRDSNSVTAIGLVTLDFLKYVGELHGDINAVSESGQIQAVKREVRSRNERNKGGFQWQTRWHHHSFPVESPKSRRLPIGDVAIDRLTRAATECSLTMFIRKRRYVMLKLLEISGGRRAEVACITTASVQRASKMSWPMLEIPSAKHGGNRVGKVREVPVSRHDIDFFLEFIEVNRRPIVARTCGHALDEGRLLISHSNGIGLTPNTITSEVHALAKHAGISEQTCPHLFRHRFVTKVLIAMIEEHRFANPDEFTQRLLSTKSLKQKLAEWTGHRNVRSLEPYIHLAFDEITGFKGTLDRVALSQSLSSFKRSVQQIRYDLGAGEPLAVASTRLESLIDALSLQLESPPRLR